MIAKLFWSDGAVAILHDDLCWSVEPEDAPLQEAAQDLFNKMAQVASQVGADPTEAGLCSVVSVYRPERVDRRPCR